MSASLASTFLPVNGDLTHTSGVPGSDDIDSALVPHKLVFAHKIEGIVECTEVAPPVTHGIFWLQETDNSQISH